MTAAVATGGDRFRHMALFYRSRGEYLPAVASFIKASRADGCPVLIAVPTGAAEFMNQELQADAGRVTLVDMTELGRNPARIIPAILTFARENRGRHVYCIIEPVWPGRSAEEVQEATAHEALSNLAFRDSWATMVCPYDSNDLPADVIADAAATHPVIIDDGQEAASPVYLGPSHLPPRCNRALPGPPAHAKALGYTDNLRAVRRFVSSAARAAGLAPARVTDLVIAISELAANTLSHTVGGGTMHIWPAAGEIICQVQDTGHITDLLARHRAPAVEVPGGKGLWLVNQTCDLVQVRTSRAGTITQLHMRLP